MNASTTPTESITVTVGRLGTASSLQWWAALDINGHARFMLMDQDGNVYT